MSRHQLARKSKTGAGDFAPFFDWYEGEQAVVSSIPDEDLIGRIIAACADWQTQGGVLVRCHFGVKTVNPTRENLGKRYNERSKRYETEWGALSGTYQTQKHCCPLAPLLNGLPSHFNPIADFASILGVDHYWVIGFIHGFDKTELYTGRRASDLKESLSYCDGLAAGRKVAEEFYVLDVGWEN